MKKATLYQRLEITECSTDAQRIKAWQKMGFTEDEAIGMTNGSTIAQAQQKLGGVWSVGYTPFPQAISGQHAVKLYEWNFGPLKDEDVSLLKDNCYVIETYIT